MDLGRLLSLVTLGLFLVSSPSFAAGTGHRCHPPYKVAALAAVKNGTHEGEWQRDGSGTRAHSGCSLARCPTKCC